MHKSLPLLGPSLLLLAEIVLPGGSANPAARLEIIQTNNLAWLLGHQLILLAFIFLYLWLFELYALLKPSKPLLAVMGTWVTVFALTADFAVGILQLLTQTLMNNGSKDQVLWVLSQIQNSPTIFTFVYLPTLGFALGLGLLAVAWMQQRDVTRKTAVLLILSGVIIATAGLAQIKLLFIIGALLLLLFSFLARPQSNKL